MQGVDVRALQHALADLDVGGVDGLGVGGVAVEAVAAFLQGAEGVEADGVQAADGLALLADRAVGADADRAEFGVEGDRGAVAQDRQALLGGQHALGVGGEAAVAGIGLAGAALDREEGAFALDGEVQRTAGLLH
ncbi:hypothetical protein D3C72_1811740 [compost metagenome]